MYEKISILSSFYENIPHIFPSFLQWPRKRRTRRPSEKRNMVKTGRYGELET